MTTSDHFTQVASVYESLRTTDEAPVQWLRQLLPEGSLLIAADISAAMLAELQASNHGRSWVAPLLSGAEGLPIRTGSLDLVTSFNSVHHFDLSRFLADAARVLRPDGQLFIYTRTPEQNARTIWGRYFPGFVEHERRLHTERALRAAVRQTRGLALVDTRTFRHLRSSTRERLLAQVEGCHYSTFSFYAPDELSSAIATFLARLPSPEVSWVDEHLLVIVRRRRRARA